MSAHIRLQAFLGQFRLDVPLPGIQTRESVKEHLVTM